MGSQMMLKKSFMTTCQTVDSVLKSEHFRATSFSIRDFSTIYTTLPHYLLKEKLIDLIERAFKKIFKVEGYKLWL